MSVIANREIMDALIELAESLRASSRRLSDLERAVQNPIGAWTDYSDISTINGWSSLTTKDIFFRRSAGIVSVVFSIGGTSNSTVANFTLPYTTATGVAIEIPIVGADNGTYLATRVLQLSSASVTVNLFAGIAGAAWTNSGTKHVQGQFFYAA